MTGIGHQRDAVRAAEAALVRHADLGLLQRLAGVKTLCHHGRLLAVGQVLVPCQPLRILRTGLHGIGHQGPAGIVANGGRQLHIAHIAVSSAVRTVAIGQKAAGADQIAQALGGFATGLGGKALLAIAAKGHASFHKRLAFRCFGKDADYAAGRVTVQGRVGAAQHFHALNAANIDVRERALAIRHGGRNVVDIQAHTTHAKGGARTIAADGKLQVLCVVLAVLDLQAGYAGQTFGEVDLQLVFTHVLTVQHGGRGGQGLQAGPIGGGADFHGVQRGCGVLGEGAQAQAAEQNGNGLALGRRGKGRHLNQQ